jgi:hypothetical protein
MIKRKINLEVLNRIKLSVESWDPQTKIKFVKNTNYLLHLTDGGLDNSRNDFKYTSEIKIIDYLTSEIFYQIQIDRKSTYTTFNCSNDGRVAGYIERDKNKVTVIPDTTNPQEQFELILDSDQKRLNKNNEEITYTRMAFSNNNKYLFVIEDSTENTYQYDIQTKSLVNIITEYSVNTSKAYTCNLDLEYIEDKKTFFTLACPVTSFNYESKKIVNFDEFNLDNSEIIAGSITKDVKKLALLTSVNLNDDFENDTKNPLILIFDLESNQIIQEIYYDVYRDSLDLRDSFFHNNFMAISYIYDDKFIIIGTHAGKDNIIFDAETGEELYVIESTGSGCFAFSEENKLLAMKTEEDEITIFKVSYEEEEIEEKILEEIPEHNIFDTFFDVVNKIKNKFSKK